MGKLNPKQVENLTELGTYEDGDGLRLVVKPTGRKSWLLRFQLAGRRREMGLGSDKSSVWGSAAGGVGAGKSPATQLTVTPTAKGTYDVWCDPQGNSCSITIDGSDDMASRARLPIYVLMASVTNNCSLEFCHNSNQDVVDLNPERHFRKKQ